MSQSTAPASLPVIRVGEDTVTLVGAHLAHVSSKSQPGMMHSVTDYRCSCRGFNYRNRCRHIEAARTARRGQAPANEARVEQMPDGRYRVLWGQAHWGGEFRYEADAEMCAQWCTDQPESDFQNWIAMRGEDR